MLKTKISFSKGMPMVDVNGELLAPLAYTTYFDECGEYEDFIKSGYRMFFVNVSFTTLPINNTNGFSPFLTGVFEGEEPDYSEFDALVSGILSRCPDALIFPRVNIAMPRWWIEKNKYEAVETPCGEARESLFSDKFKKDGAELLKTLVSHIRNASYGERVAGYQLCGGTTQEWIHHDLCGSFSEMGNKKFVEWAYQKHGIKDVAVPEREDFFNGKFTEETKLYYEFCNTEHTKTIEHFARVLKKEVGFEQITGVFYGYNCFVPDTLWGLQGLGEIISSPYIDFFSSPCCYDGNRALGIDWGDMLPVDSVKHHSKLAFIECDVRTSLTRRMQASRPGMYSEELYPMVDDGGNKTAWSGPPTTELSVSAVRKAFAHQYTRSSGIWWFDMWGGWYHSEELMAELSVLKKLYENGERSSVSEVALFVDEKAYRNLPRGHFGVHRVNEMRFAMGNTGIPFDMYMVEDAEAVLHKYKAAIFTAYAPSEDGERALAMCKEHNIPVICTQGREAPFSIQELRDTLTSFGVHCYNDEDCVVYCAKDFVAIHTVRGGEVTLRLPQKRKIKHLQSGRLLEGDVLTLDCSEHATEMLLLL